MGTKDLKVGDIFYYQLTNGLYTLLRVFELMSERSEKMQNHYGTETVAIHTVPFYEKETPCLEYIDLDFKLYKDAMSYAFNRKPKNALAPVSSFYMKGEISNIFVYVGNIPILEGELKLAAMNFYSDERIVLELADGYENYQSSIIAQKEKKKQRANKRAIKKIMKAPFYENWKGFLKEEIISEVKNISQNITNCLLMCKTSEEYLMYLNSYIISLNDLNKKHNKFIGTLEREHICDFIQNIAESLNVWDELELDHLREW